MSHRISCPALHAARVVLKHYDFTVKPEWKAKNPKLEPDERCVAIVIDYGTQIFHVVQLRPELRYWQEHMREGTATAPQIVTFLRRVVEAFEKLPRPDEREHTATAALASPPGATWKAQQHRVSRPSEEAARILASYYDIQPKEGLTDAQVQRFRISVLIDVSTSAFRCLRILPVIRDHYRQIVEGKLGADEVAEFLKSLGIQLERLPTYADRDEETKLL